MMHLPDVKARRMLLRAFQFSATGVFAALAISACGGGSGDASLDKTTAPSGFSVSYDTKGYLFHWSATAGATHYELVEDPDGLGPLPEAQVGGAIAPNSYAHSLAAQLLYERVNASYRLRACDASGCGAFTSAVVPDLTRAIGYFRASAPAPRWSGRFGTHDFGRGVALSADGSTLAIGAPGDSSASHGINGDPSPSEATDYSGAVYVYARVNGRWDQQAYVKASNQGGSFGATVALSADGNTLVAGAPAESSNASGVNGNQADTSVFGAGAAYVFTRTTGTWAQQAYIKPVLEVLQPSTFFGSALALSADGKTLAVGSPGEYNGLNTPNQINFGGAVHVYARNNDTWTVHSRVTSSEAEDSDRFGTQLAISGDGQTLAVGAPHRKGFLAPDALHPSGRYVSSVGAAYVLTRNGATWTQQAALKPPVIEYTAFGTALALSTDGNTLAVGAPGYTDAVTPRPVSPPDTAAPGTVYTFHRQVGQWSQQTLLKPTISEKLEGFGRTLAMSADGRTVAVGAPAEMSKAVGINGDPTDNSARLAGAAYLFTQNGNAWSQRAYLKASNTASHIDFSQAIALSADGNTLAIASRSEATSATDPNTVQTGTGGSVYLY